MPAVFSRRKLLIGLSGLGAAAAGGATWALAGDARDAVLEYLRETLPGVTLDEEAVGKCLEDFTARWSRPKKLVIFSAWRSVGVATTASFHPRLDKLQRLLLTFFLVNSNFFRVKDPSSETIVYYTRPEGSPCASPFSNLTPPPPPAPAPGPSPAAPEGADRPDAAVAE